MTLKADDIDWGDAFNNNSLAFKGRRTNGNGQRSEPIEAELEVTGMDSIEIKPVRYVWKDHLAFGKPTIIAGDPGGGKSMLTCDIVARASRGLAWPDGLRGCEPCRSLILAAEDAPDDTIKPRLLAMGADMKMIGVANTLKAGDKERFVQLGDVQPIAKALQKFGATILVVDPLMAYMGGTDSHKDSDVRGLLAPLMKMAEELGVAVLGIMHLSKGGNRPAIYRIGGSIGFIGLSRMGFGVVLDPENTSRRLLTPIKHNLAQEPPTLAFSLGDGGVLWEPKPVLGIKVNELMNTHLVEPEDQGDADALVAQLFADGESMSAKKVQQAAMAWGISRSAMSRASKRAGIVIRAKHGTDGKLDGWHWFPPVEPDLTPVTEKRDLVGSGENTNDQPDPTRSHLGSGDDPDLPIFDPRGAFRKMPGPTD